MRVHAGVTGALSVHLRVRGGIGGLRRGLRRRDRLGLRFRFRLRLRLGVRVGIGFVSRVLVVDRADLRDVLALAGEILQRIRNGEFITLNNSRYVLVELDFYSSIEPILEYCEELVSAGLVPVIAHPERFEAVKEDEQAAYRLKKRGCLLQVNSGSLFGAFGRTSEGIAHDLMEAAAADLAVAVRN